VSGRHHMMTGALNALNRTSADLIFHTTIMMLSWTMRCPNKGDYHVLRVCHHSLLTTADQALSTDLVYSAASRLRRAWMTRESLIN